jgi:hypothetical protein
VLDRLKARLRGPQPSGPPELVRRFSATDPTVARDCVTVDQDAWAVVTQAGQSVRLFEVADPQVDECVVNYRATMRTEDLTGRAFLEMWCRLPGRGEFFSKGLDQAVTGTTDWSSHEIPFLLKKGQRPDLIRLNVAVEGAGKVWLKDVELLKTPLAS